jgi:Flp pilus assembly protein TadD
LFNLAVSLEQLARRTDAERAWRQYLDLDPDSDWAREARQHLEGTAPR